MRLLVPIAFVVLCGCATHVSDPFWVRTDGGPLRTVESFGALPTVELDKMIGAVKGEIARLENEAAEIRSTYMAQAVALGFIEVTKRGRGGNAESREPSLYRLTFAHDSPAILR